MGGVLPDGYVGLVVADTRRAIEWEAGLRAAGFEVVRVETRGADADRGDWRIAVAQNDKPAASNFVSRVLSGEQKLPSQPMLSRTGYVALLLVGAVIAVLIAAGLWSR